MEHRVSGGTPACAAGDIREGFKPVSPRHSQTPITLTFDGTACATPSLSIARLPLGTCCQLSLNLASSFSLSSKPTNLASSRTKLSKRPRIPGPSRR